MPVFELSPATAVCCLSRQAIIITLASSSRDLSNFGDNLGFYAEVLLARHAIFPENLTRFLDMLEAQWIKTHKAPCVDR